MYRIIVYNNHSIYIYIYYIYIYIVYVYLCICIYAYIYAYIYIYIYIYIYMFIIKSQYLNNTSDNVYSIILTRSIRVGNIPGDTGISRRPASYPGGSGVNTERIRKWQFLHRILHQPYRPRS